MVTGEQPNSKLVKIEEAEPIEIRPHHYVSRGMEAWDVIEAFRLNFNTGSAFKYIARQGCKPTVSEQIRDLSKAITYLKREIKLLEAKIPFTEEPKL